MKKTPKISVLLAVNNGEKNIEKSILSILDQTYTNIELIICATGCTDKTIQIIGRIINDCQSKSKIYFTTLPMLNTSGALNWALLLATGDYISIHDPDEILMPDKFEKQLQNGNNSFDRMGLIKYGDMQVSEVSNMFDFSQLHLNMVE